MYSPAFGSSTPSALVEAAWVRFYKNPLTARARGYRIPRKRLERLRGRNGEENIMKATRTIMTALAATALLAAGSGLFACKKKEPETIKIGAILPLTGPVALTGEWGANGLRLAEDYINGKTGPDSKKIEIIFEDGQGDPKTSLNAFNKLVDVDGVKIIFSIVSSVDLALIPEANKRGVLFISHATHPKVSNAGRLIFRHSPVVEQEVALITPILRGTKGPAVLAYMVDDYGVALKDLLMKEEYPGEVKVLAFEKGETDFASLSAKIRAEKPSTVVISGYGKNLGQLIVKLKEQGYKGDIVVTLGFVVTGADVAAGSAMEGVRAVDFDIDKNQSDYKKINNSYKIKYGSDMPTSALIFFNSALLINDAVKGTKGEPEAVAENIKNMGVFAGVGERLVIKKSNDITPTLRVREY